MTNKLSIALDLAKLPALQAAHAAIAPLFKQLDESAAILAKMRADEATLQKDIAQLDETVSYTDAEASFGLKNKRSQLELLQRQAHRLETSLPAKAAELAAHLDTLNTLIPHATLPERDKVAAKIARAIKPVFGSIPENHQAAVELAPELISFRNFFHRRWYADGMSTAHAAATALPVLAALIEQTNPWAFAAE